VRSGALLRLRGAPLHDCPMTTRGIAALALCLAVVALSSCTAKSPPSRKGSQPASLSATPSSAADLTARCTQTTTIGFEQCAQGVLSGLNKQLGSVYASTLAGLRQDGTEGRFTSGAVTTDPITGLERAEQQFVDYRKAMCQTTYDAWVQGSIRGANYLLCEIDLTQEQIAAIQGLVAS
jgi:uncharacterized protein YecT (DUF1311 family)